MRIACRVVLAAVILALLPCSGLARPEFYQIFTRLYHPTPGTPLANARCQTCHTMSGPPELNRYGLAVKTTLDQSGMLTEAGLRSIEGEDSDGDGKMNGVEIAAGRLPGDPAIGTTPAPAGMRQPARLVPIHMMHPLFVHFPIALLVVGALLEILGARLRRTELRAAGFINFAFGALVAPVAVGTGVAWLLRAGFTLQGLLLLHLACGIATTVCAILVVLLHRSATRAGREADSALYWGLMGATLVFVSATGHLGALMVHGW
jgi:uncharacterized membrane protein